jgi:uncharacterized repeat protein (TIGR02543 family)
MYIKTGPTTWKNTAAAYIKTGPTIWERIKQGYIKTGPTLWKRFFNEANLPVEITGPTIRSANTSGTGTIYDGSVATSPQFLNADLFGKDGSYSNYTSITARRFSYADSLDATVRSTLVFDDRFSSAGGVTTANRTALDGKYLFYEVQVNNGTGDDFINPVSSPKKLIKSYPALTSMEWAEAEQVGTQLVLNYDIENYYYNKIDPALSYVRWWRSSTADAGGTLVQEETITATTTGTPTSTQRLGTSYYTPTSSDIGYYIVAEITGRSSYTEHYGYTDNYMMGSYPTGGPIGAALTVTGVSFTDSNDRSGKNARGNLVTATTTKLNWTVNGVNTATTFRVRYRVLNNQTGLYYNPDDPTTALAAGSAWLSYTDNYYGSGTISSVSISGTTATIYDQFTIDEAFNGSTYSGGLSRWSFQYEISVVNSSGTRLYWQYPSSMSTTQTNDYWDIDPTTDPSISASPSTIAPGGTVTFSGTFNPYPASLASYPHSYRIVYGTSPATDSGWITLGSGTANQTYTNTKVYDTAGSYSAYIETTPSYTTNSASVTVSDVKVPPTIGTPTISAVGAFTAGQRRLSVPFTAVTNSGPAYQIYWYSIATAPGVLVTIDGSGTTSPILDATGPLTIGRWYAYIRSSATTTTSGSVAPSTTLSNWSDGAAFYVDGTRTLSYNKNTTDTVGSLPSDTSGTDPWDGWVTTVSANTPTRTNYTFNGYNTSSDGTSGTNYAASAAITLTSNVTLYAKWTANLYTITFDSKGGTSVTALTQSTIGGSIAKPTDPTKTSNTFGGWSTTDGGTTAVTWPRTPSANETLYAIWAETPTTPTSLSSAITDGKIVLTFAGGTGSQYDIFYANSNSRPTDQQAFTDFPDVTSPYTATTLTSRGDTRWFWVRKSTGTARSNWFPATGTVVTGRIPLLAPPTPVITNSSALSDRLSWHWTAPTPSSTEDSPSSWDYALTESTAVPTSGITNITTRPLSTSVLTITGLTVSTDYYLHVRAKNADATGSWTYLKGTTSAAPFVTPAWNGTMPGWTAANNFERINSPTASRALKYGWNNGTFSFSGSTRGTASTDRGWDFYVSGTEPSTTTTVRIPTHTRAYNTTAITGNTVQGNNYMYRVDPTWNVNSRYGSIRPYQYGTDGNKYVRGTQPDGTWSASI